MNASPSTSKKLDELYDLIDDMEIALMTTRRADGHLVTRPMATQDRGPLADLWFVTNIETHKTDEIEQDPHVSLGYYDDGSKEWVSVSGTATISQDRAKIHELYAPDWKAVVRGRGRQPRRRPRRPPPRAHLRRRAHGALHEGEALEARHALRDSRKAS